VEVKSRPWRIREVPSSELTQELANEVRLSPLAVQICLQRGLKTAAEIQSFLVPRIEDLTAALSIADMDRAVARLIVAREQGERVRIYGDYDVDGTTGTALLSRVFAELGFAVDARQPDRFTDGYGLNVAAIAQAKEDGIALLLSVDCGITSFDAAREAQALGLDLVVVDHHQVDPVKGLPHAVAVVNPQRSDCASGLRQLCGCGLAFFLAIALRAAGRERGWFTQGREPNLRQHLDLVALATAADMVPLVGDNRILMFHGLEVLKNSRKPGIRALLRAARLDPADLSPGDLGFVLGPRINASGRMSSATLAWELLTTDDEVRAEQLAAELERLNADRMKVQNEIWEQVKTKIVQQVAAGHCKHGIVVGEQGWHEGVVGIVASRVTETFHRPAVVIGLNGDRGKGSVRSYGGRDVLEALRESAEHLIGFGGHRHAAGLSVQAGKLEAFAAAFDASLGKIPSVLDPLWAEAQVSVADLQTATVLDLERLGPFGPGNAEPVFIVSACIRERQVLKEKHLKLVLASEDDNATRQAIEAMWFYGVERCEGEREYFQTPGHFVEWAGVPQINRFRGRIKPTLRIKDCRKISTK